MSVEIPFTWPEYHFDPGSGLFRYADPRYGEVTANLEVLTGGNYRVVGRSIQVLGDVPGLRRGQFIGSLSILTPARLVAYGGGRATVFNALPASEIGAERRITGNYVVSASAQIELPSGEVRSVDLPFTATNKIGTSLTVREVAGRIANYSYVSNIRDPVTGQMEQPGAGYRFATPQESVIRAMIGQLFDKSFGVLAELATLGLKDENGNALETESDVAAYIARIGYSNISGGWVGILG